MVGKLLPERTLICHRLKTASLILNGDRKQNF